MTIKHAVALALAVFPPAVFSASSPWLPEPGTFNTAISYVFQTADKFYFGNQLVDLPADREQHTVGAYLEYGVTDSVALDAFVGYSATDFIDTGPNGTAPFGASLDGLTDTNLGIRWRALDELTGAPVSLTFRAAGIIEGSYRAGAINAVGDGSSGGEFSALLGRFFENGVSLSGEIGYRTRSRPVPDEFFANWRAGYAISPKWGIGISYQVAESLSGIDIGGPGFSVPRFPAVKEDAQIFALDISYRFTSKSYVSVNWGKNLTGRNTTSQSIAGINFGYSFY